MFGVFISLVELRVRRAAPIRLDSRCVVHGARLLDRFRKPATSQQLELSLLQIESQNFLVCPTSTTAARARTQASSIEIQCETGECENVVKGEEFVCPGLFHRLTATCI